MLAKRYEENEWVLACDECGEEADGSPFDTFEDANEWRKENGWKARKIDGEWGHICEECDRIKHTSTRRAW